MIEQDPQQDVPPEGDTFGRGWLTRDRIKALMLLLITMVVFYLCYLMMLPFMPSLAWALALAIVAAPFHDRVQDRVVNRNLAAAISTFVVAVIIGALSFVVVERLIAQVGDWGGNLDQVMNSSDWLETLEETTPIGPVVHWVRQRVDLRGPIETAKTEITSFVSGLVVDSVWSAAQILITFFILFYFLRDQHRVLRLLKALLPLGRTESERMFRRVTSTIHATIYGTIIIALIQGSLGGLMFWMLGLPMPMLWGIIMALLALIPILGAFIVWIPAAIWLLLAGAWVKALTLTLWGALVVGLIDNLLYPMFVGRRLSLHTVPVFIAVVGGLFVFGASGLILGPVVLAIADGLVHVWAQRTALGGSADVML